MSSPSSNTIKYSKMISSKHGYKKSRVKSNTSDSDLLNIVMPKADTADNYFFQYLSFIVWTVALAFCSSVIIKKLCYAAAGSGIPDLKSIFSGFWNSSVVQPRVLIWKVLGLLFSYGSGLSIGKEGPYIHISAILANTLLNIKPFKNIATNETQRSQMLASCCALGVAATFGSPIGGVLFSIEVTGTYYLIQNYWRAFFTATVGAVGIKILLSTPSNDLLESYRTSFESLNLATVQLLAFIITGILCGLLASLFIYMYSKIYTWKKHNQDFIKKITPYGEVIIVAAVTAVITFPLKFLRLDHASAVHTMFTAHDGVNTEELKVWTDSMPFNNSILLACFLYILVKLVLTAVSVTLPVPYGIYIPLFAIGAAVGRFVGESMKLIFPHMKDIYPTGYAVVGAAALCGGATRTVSSAVIILELTNDMTFLVPVLLGVVLSCGIGNLLNHSIYDCFLRNKGLPYLPFVKIKSDSLVAKDVMKREFRYVTRKTTLLRIQSVLDNVLDYAIPIVESDDNLFLIGTISRTTLEEVISYHERLHSYSLKSPIEGEEDGSGNTIITINSQNHNYYDNNDNDNSLLLQEESSQIEMNLIPKSESIDQLDSNQQTQSQLQNGSTDHQDINNNNNSGDIRSSLSLNNEIIIDIVHMELQNPWVVIDTSPIHIVESMPVRKIIFMFMMLGGNVLFVTNKGQLVGIINKTDIVQKGYLHHK
ncbi:chloride channel protein [Tieghemostelium lacteum]|uniref:Chloride channel protein n=1 Tax=Tieghemostelium lacteum TaxID=361077 RepID=A0A152A3F3_TIELA|nr:chloride channel protein [Tieghemostelium lacteum]|eukprot:KYR00739.1 chloride channel protein [Tieghemostelium lacteum]